MAEQQVQITDLDPNQLQEVKKQLDEVGNISPRLPQELDHLTSSFGQLKSAQAKFRSCVSDIDDLKPEAKGGKGGASLTRDNQVLVPLTSSLYVPGKLGDVSHVVVDIGTGYYVRKVGGGVHAD